MIKFNPPFFLGYIEPDGFLDREPATHALWNYYICARGTYETHVMDPIVLVGDKDPEANYLQLFKSMAEVYGVKPEEMAKCWDRVDMQCVALDLPKLPDEDKYRFNSIATIH